MVCHQMSLLKGRVWWVVFKSGDFARESDEHEFPFLVEVSVDTSLKCPQQMQQDPHESVI